MAAKKSAVETYTVTAELKVTISTEITAANFEEATTMASAMKPSDFLTLDQKSDLIDYEAPRVTGIFR